MFKKILIANRGEIACRIISTARRLGIETVAVYSDADTNARHVRLADEAVWIGASPAKESYLCISNIVDAALKTKAEAIHPGYGFLSENEDFCEACDKAGLVFIGPPASAIRAMGSKSEAKKLMGSANVPLTPGYHGDEQSPEFLLQMAKEITFPVLIKAASGGGGKGMRLVNEERNFIESLASCKREAASSFGDDHVLVEKYITKPRHIEIQVFADSFGNCVHLFERDCSVQRRHQKVLEEAPAPGMADERRAAMGAAAIEAAKAVGYVGAGTVEFIVNQDGEFYFMEMNTRLQVEHPVTEMITGLDLVEWQFRVASGEPLPLQQNELGIRGHAIEARVYAEDPAKGFLPSTGTLSHLVIPCSNKNVRIDSGVEQGDVISPHYDPMIAKLIVWDESRSAALARMEKALADYQIVGVSNNLNFLKLLVRSQSFANADLDTGLIEREKDSVLPEAMHLPPYVLAYAATEHLIRNGRKALNIHVNSSNADSPWDMKDGWLLNLSPTRSLKYCSMGKRYTVLATYLTEGFSLEIDGQIFLTTGEHIDGPRFYISLNGRKSEICVVRNERKIHLFIDGDEWLIDVSDSLSDDQIEDEASGALTAPMPGKVVALLANVGEVVERGTPILVLEAMKMEHSISAPCKGTLKAYNYAVNDQVTEGSQLFIFDPIS